MGIASKTIYRIPAYLSFIIFMFDLIALSLSAWVSNVSLSTLNGHSFVFQEDTTNYYLFFNALILLNFCNRGHYTNRVPYWQQVRTIIKSIFAIIALTAITYFIFSINVNLGHVLFNWLMALVFLLLARSLVFRILNHFKSWHLPITLLGDNQMVIDCMYAFCNDGHTGFKVDTIMLRDRIKKPICLDFIPEWHPPIKHIDASGDYLPYIEENKDNFYIIDMEGLRGDNRDRLITFLENNDIDYAIAPPTKRLHLYGMEPLYFFGNDVMILHSRTRHEESSYLFAKRIMDVCISGMLLPFLGIVTALVYLLKRAEGSQTPVFYGGYRLGKDGKEFKCWKFCTMHKDADKMLDDLLAKDPEMKKEWDAYQKLSNDPRIDSKISGLLRKVSLDELPQLWNVFVCDMSLVGPRPILPQQVKEYGQSISQYKSLRPGITGLWQVSGRNETTFEQRAYWDRIWLYCIVS